MTNLPPELARYRRIKDKEAAALLGISVQTLRNARHKREGSFAKLPYCRMGSAVRYCIEDVLAFAEAHKVEVER